MTVSGVPRIGRPSGGHVFDHLDLFEDDALLALDVLGLQRGAHDHVGQQVDGERQVLVEHLDVVAGVLLRREGVELTTDRIDRLRYLLRGPALRALEEHVLDEVRHARLGVRLVARATLEPDAHADRTDMRHRLGEQPQPRRQGLSVRHDPPSRPRYRPDRPLLPVSDSQN
jgi:hypothetical protein